MSNMPRLTISLVFASFALAALLASGPAAAAEDAKYQFMKATENRVWRLNTESGEITVCTLDGERLLCTTSSDAAMPTKKSYAEMQADKAEAQQQMAAQRKKDKDVEMKMFERFLAFFRELITMSQEKGS